MISAHVWNEIHLLTLVVLLRYCINLYINVKSYTKYRKRKRLRSADKIKHNIDVATAETADSPANIIL